MLINKSLYFSMQSFSLMCHYFMAYEIIYILRNPISPMKNRLNIYIFITFFMLIINLILILFDPDSSNFDKTSLNNNFFYKSNLVMYINLGLFFLLISEGLFACLVMLTRFCKGTSIAKTIREKFVSKSVIYYSLYFIVNTPYYLNALLFVFNQDMVFIEVSIILQFSQVFLLFFYRATSTNFYEIIFCRKNENINNNENTIRSNRLLQVLDYVNPDEPLTVMISKSINFEFITCILYGLSIIFEKIGKKNLAYSNGNDSSLSENEYFNRKSQDIQMDSLIRPSQINSTENSNQKKYILISMKKHVVYYEKIDDDLDIKVDYDFTNSFHSSSEDFKENISFRVSSEKQDGIIIEHYPKIFKSIRDNDKILSTELLSALDPYLNRTNIQKIKESQGKSGSFFFFTHDNKFLIKTLKRSELKTLLNRFVQNYFDHCFSNDTLIAKIYGVYTIIIK